MALRRAEELQRWVDRFLSSWMTWTLWLGMILFAVYFAWLSDVNASNYDAHNHDLSHMWQSVWNVAHGHGFEFSLTGDIMNVPRLSVHADYFLLLLAPLSWLWPHFSVLLVVQAVGVAAAAWFIERIARRWTGSRELALALAGAYLLYGPMQFAVLWHFHSITLAPLFVLGAVEAIIARRNNWLIWLWVALALITKEQVGLILGPLLWIVARWSGVQRLGWWLGGSAVAFSLLHFFIIIPGLRDSGNSHFVWEFYYGSLGATLPEQLIALLDPREIVGRLLTVAHLKSAALLLLPLIGLPLLAPISLLAILAIAPHWLSDNQSQHTLLATNHVLAVIILFLGAIRATAKRIDQSRWKPRRLALVVFGASIVGSIVMSPLPWSTYANPGMRQWDPQVAVMRQQHDRIPSNAIVGYSRGAGAEFRDRRYAWLLPRGIETLDYGIVFTSARMAAGGKIADQDRRLNEFFRSTAAFETVYTQGRLSIYRRNHAVPLPPMPNLEL